MSNGTPDQGLTVHTFCHCPVFQQALRRSAGNPNIKNTWTNCIEFVGGSKNIGDGGIQNFLGLGGGAGGKTPHTGGLGNTDCLWQSLIHHP